MQTLSRSFSVFARKAAQAAQATRSADGGNTASVKGQEPILADDQTFEGLVERVQGTVVVDFFANWCGPCRMLAGPLTEATQKAGLPLIKVDVDVAQQVAGKYDISSLPTVVIFHKGKPVNQFVGAQPPQAIAQFIEQTCEQIKVKEASSEA
jgi:thioredoxin 1